VSVTVKHFHSSLIFADKAGAYQSGAFSRLDSNGWLPALQPKILD